MFSLRGLLAASLLAGLPLTSLAQRPPAKGLSGKEIAARTIRGTVWVLRVTGETPGKGYRIGGTGSGSLIDAQKKLILTNYHVVGESEKAIVCFPDFDAKGKPIPEREYYLEKLGERGRIGKVVARDAKRDLALIQLDVIAREARALPLARDSVDAGETVHSIGNPGASGALWAYTSGSVKAVYRKKFTATDRTGRERLEVDAKVVETTSPVNAGDSGGPVVNERGELVAVTQGGIFSADTRQISFFIDVSEVRALLQAKKIKIAGSVVGGPSTTLPKDPIMTEGPEPSTEAMDEQRAKQQLLFAQDLAKAGKTEAAVEKCEKIIKQYPKTQAAAEAKKLLEKLGS